MAGIMWGASWPKRVILLLWGEQTTQVPAAKILPVAYQNIALRQMGMMGMVYPGRGVPGTLSTGR